MGKTVVRYCPLVLIALFIIQDVVTVRVGQSGAQRKASVCPALDVLGFLALCVSCVMCIATDLVGSELFIERALRACIYVILM
ncbi:hypothetical protein HHI36_006829 [Cryptolaemus montrouzieri]|uniref:Uncharacterized protein n=1 Tax=Cryptolaemus montrouzieri TaxID=559131 RepID=A0ABD2MMU7_9CUCU